MVTEQVWCKQMKTHSLEFLLLQLLLTLSLLFVFPFNTLLFLHPFPHDPFFFFPYLPFHLFLFFSQLFISLWRIKGMKWSALRILCQSKICVSRSEEQQYLRRTFELFHDLLNLASWVTRTYKAVHNKQSSVITFRLKASCFSSSFCIRFSWASTSFCNLASSICGKASKYQYHSRGTTSFKKTLTLRHFM